MLKSKNLRPMFLVVVTLLLQAGASAQSMSEFEQWKRQQLGEFKQFRDEMDREFADFLKQRWKAFDSARGVIRDEKPKPVDIPVAKLEDRTPRTQPEEKPQPVVKVEPETIAPPPAPIPVIPAPVIPGPSERLVSFYFLGHRLAVVDGISASFNANPGPVSFHNIQRQFTDLASSDFPPTIEHLNRIRRELSLNDWAYVQLVLEFSDQVTVSANDRKLVSWFLLLKSGLDARVAYDPNELYLLVAVKQKLYDIAYIKYGDQKYYSVTREKRLPLQLFSYDGQYPKRLEASDVALVREINSKPEQETREFKFNFGGKNYRLALPYNRHTIDFLATYPQMDIDQYFRAPLDTATSRALLAQLRPIVEGMTETDAVNLLLKFVQTAFRYETDQQQFGEENYMFMEETIYYPASDCEDRSILFAWLVKNLLGLQVVGLDFPGHIATAVALARPVGATVDFRGKRYTIADPTYINARVGMKMPQFKSVNPGVIPVL